MKKYMPVIKDGLILLIVSTAFVSATNWAFKGLKKTGDTDPMVTAINQGKIENLEEHLGPKAFEKVTHQFKSLQDFQASRANRADTIGRTPLMWAAYSNLSEEKATVEIDTKRILVVDFLLKNGALPNQQDKEGWTALMWASWSGLPQVVTKLIEAGADTGLADLQGNMALTIAAQRGNFEVVKYLLEKGANKNAQTKKGQSALDLANQGLLQNPDRSEKYKSILEILK